MNSLHLTRKAFNHSAVRVVEHHGVKRPKHTETKRDSRKPLVNCGKTWKKLFEGAKLGDMGDEECFWNRLFVVWKRWNVVWTPNFEWHRSDAANVRQLRCTKLSGTDFVHRVGTACSYCMCHPPRQSRWDAWTNGPSFTSAPKYAKVLRSVGGWCRPANQWGVLFLDKFWDARLQHSLETKSFVMLCLLFGFRHPRPFNLMLSGFRLVPGSSWICTNSQGVGWALFHVSSWGDGLYNLSKVPCSEFAAVPSAVPSAVQSAELWVKAVKGTSRPTIWRPASSVPVS